MKLRFTCLCLLGTLFCNAQQDLASLVKAYEKVGYHGAILVAKGHQILYQGGYGIADQQTQVKNDAQTRFKTESIGKMLTATLVMQEVEKGTLSLEDNLDHFFPGVYTQNGHLIKVKHLLSHTSGITETELNPNYKPGGNYSRADILKFRAEAPLAFTVPGKEFRYSNLGFTILADILQEINHKPFTELIKERIFIPSKMEHTGHPADTAINIHAAKPYLWVSSTKFIQETRTIGKYANASGGWMSTIQDFYHFMRDFNQGSYISKKSFEIMGSGGIEFQPGYWYTYGLNRAAIGTNGKQIYGHTGGGGGYACDIYVEPESGYIVINFMNMYGDGRPMTKNIFKWLLKEKLDTIKKWDDIALGDVMEKKGLAHFDTHYREELTALGMLPKTAGGYNRLASSFDDVNDQASREILLRVGLKEFPQSGQLWLNLGRSLYKQNRYEAMQEALAHAQQIATSTKDDFLARMAKIELDKLIKK
ncbi:MAG: serine hydrolase domain-containing protein [Pedobacter sp.]|nr:serine hydrolase domain-containing protein [Pedobacter sp.]MDQ8052620.1 serine hydrolase domain-containing protein [Pedobacter sp.]